MKTYYIIRFKGLFEQGCVTLNWITKTKEVKHKSDRDAVRAATKFRFEWCAKFWCWCLNRNNDQLRIFKVEKRFALKKDKN